jgi:hypothetical protein
VPAAPLPGGKTQAEIDRERMRQRVATPTR